MEKLSGRDLLQKASDEFVDWFVKNNEEEQDEDAFTTITNIKEKHLKRIENYSKKDLLEIIKDLLGDSLELLNQRLFNEEDYVEYYFEYLYRGDKNG